MSQNEWADDPRVNTARDARLHMQVSKRTIKGEVMSAHMPSITREVAERTASFEADFAKALRRAHDEGVPQSVLRSEVLRTTAWGTWTYWRDKAGIPAAREQGGVNA